MLALILLEITTRSHFTQMVNGQILMCTICIKYDQRILSGLKVGITTGNTMYREVFVFNWARLAGIGTGE